jgi:predicted nucleic acid-binding protein
MADYTALFDSCVLYPFTVRDTLIRLALTGLFRAKWTSKIDQEWLENLATNGKERNKLTRTRDLMRAAVLDWEVVGYEPIIESLNLPDANDRHVLAAAIVGKADTIITTNVKHFPGAGLEAYDLEAQHPDDFVACQFDLKEQAVIASFKKQRTSLKSPAMSVDEFLHSLERSQLWQTAERLRKWKDLI